MKLFQLAEQNLTKKFKDVEYHIVKNWWDKKSVALVFVTKPGSQTENYKKFSWYDDSIFDGFNKEEIIGYVTIKKSSSNFYGTDLHMDEDQRRKKYASSLYDFVEKSLNVKLEPEFQLTDDGKKFWDSRK